MIKYKTGSDAVRPSEPRNLALMLGLFFYTLNRMLEPIEERWYNYDSLIIRLEYEKL